jgi:hypothetical protein
MPGLKLQLTPFFDSEGEGQYIDIRMIVNDLDIPKQKHDAIFEHTLVRGPVRTMQYDAKSVTALDCTGLVPMYTEDSKDGRQRKWHLDRDLQPGSPEGLLTVLYRAIPRDTNDFTQCGPQIALERDENGLTGAGMGFIIILADDVLVDVVVEWDLSSSPTGTRAVCTFGEGRRVEVKKIKVSILSESFFAVGSSLKSYPPNDTTSFGMYWLADPPFDAVALGARMESLSKQMAAFFHDPKDLYRIFMRRNPYRCASGRGLYQGFVFSWTPLVPPRDEDSITQLLFHEFVHNWPRIGPTTGTIEDYKDGWFNEGIAEYYSLILPHRFGIFTEEELIEKLNLRVSNYYTNPDRHVLNKDIANLFWKPGHVNKVPYERGLLYFLRLSYELQKANHRPLDDLILDMLQLRRTNRPHGIHVWLSLIEAELGPQVLQDYEDMSNAKLIVLAPEHVNATLHMSGWTFKRQNQEELCLGFAEESLSNNPRVVKGLDLESRAAKVGGVREGDQITQKFSFFSEAEKWNNSFSMTVVRRQVIENEHEEGVAKGEELKDLTWWPRSWEKVESYQFFRT